METTHDPGQPPAVQRPHVLSEDEAASRALLLGELQAALAGIGVRSVVARNHRLVLRWNIPGPFRPSGPTDPQLHIFGPAGTTVATTDGIAYHLTAGQQCPADDPAAAAELITGCLAAARS
jgi:hypothetical protein